MDEFAEAHAEMLIAAALVVDGAPGLIGGQTLVEAAQNLGVGKIALGEPSLGDDAESLAQQSEELGAFGDDDDGLLHR